MKRSFGYFEDEDKEFEPSGIIDLMVLGIPWCALVLLFFTIPLFVVAAEKMIQWNDLSPTTDLSSPGQVILFAVGFVGICDACLGIIRHLTTRGDHVVGGRGTVHARRRHDHNRYEL